MSKATSLLYTVMQLRRVLEPRPKPVRILPSVFIDDDGQDLAGHEDSNERARRYAEARHIGLKEYVNIPDDDGGEL